MFTTEILHSMIEVDWTHAVLLLLHLNHRPIFEAPLHDIRLLTSTLDELALTDG